MYIHHAYAEEETKNDNVHISSIFIALHYVACCTTTIFRTRALLQNCKLDANTDTHTHANTLSR